MIQTLPCSVGGARARSDEKPRELDHVERAAPQRRGLAALRRRQPLHTVLGEHEVIAPPSVIDPHLDPAAPGLDHGMADGIGGCSFLWTSAIHGVPPLTSLTQNLIH